MEKVSDLTFEQAKKDDAQKILNYLNLVGGESDNLLFGANGFKTSLEDEEKILETYAKSQVSAMFIGKIGEEIVAFGAFTSSKRVRIAHQAELALSVKKKYWGKGIGTKLLETLVDFGKNNGVTEVLSLGVKADNFSAIALYEKFGFEKIGNYPKFFKIDNQYYDKIMMNLYL